MEDIFEKYLYMVFVALAVIFNIIKAANKKKKLAQASQETVTEDIQETRYSEPSYEEEEEEEEEDHSDYYEEVTKAYTVEDIQKLISEEQEEVEVETEPVVSKIDYYDGVEGTSLIEDAKEHDYKKEEEVVKPIIGPEDFSDTENLKKAFLYSEIFDRKEY